LHATRLSKEVENEVVAFVLDLSEQKHADQERKRAEEAVQKSRRS